jgi:hypothetical protein
MIGQLDVQYNLHTEAVGGGQLLLFFQDVKPLNSRHLQGKNLQIRKNKLCYYSFIGMLASYEIHLNNFFDSLTSCN